jgi:hypothetical protein
MKGKNKMATIIEIKKDNNKIYFQLGENQELNAIIKMFSEMIPLDQKYEKGYKYVEDFDTKIQIQINEKTYTAEEFETLEKVNQENQESN